MGAVIEKIKKEGGVWFKVLFREKDSLLNEKISVQFEDLPIRNGLDRIFSMMNHCLIFDRNGKLLGVFFLGKPEKGRGRSTLRRSVHGRTSRRYMRR